MPTDSPSRIVHVLVNGLKWGSEWEISFSPHPLDINAFLMPYNAKNWEVTFFQPKSHFEAQRANGRTCIRT